MLRTPANVDLDAGSSSDGLQVEQFVESNKDLSDISDGTLNLSGDSLKVFMKLNVEKPVSSAEDKLSEDKGRIPPPDLSGYYDVCALVDLYGC